MPPLLEMYLSNSSRVYCPEKQTLMSSLEGMLPARSGAKGPSPSKALFTSTIFP